MSEWIKVEDRLPVNGEDILFNVPSCYGVEKGRRFDDKWISDRTSPYNDQVDWQTVMVDRWMPLPVPPTEETPCTSD
jgi:Protein of unknown function (DUF551)